MTVVSPETKGITSKWLRMYFSSAERKELATQILYQVKLSFMNEGEISAFSEMEENYRCVTGRPTFRMA